MELYPRQDQNRVVAKLLDALPELRPAYMQHIADNAEPLPYVFLADAVRYIEHELDCRNLPEHFLDRFAQAIEDALESDPDSHDLIGIGILEAIKSSTLWEKMSNRLGKRSLDVVSEG